MVLFSGTQPNKCSKSLIPYKPVKVDLKENEVVIKASDSNQLNGKGKILGKLILTNQRIYFKSIQQEDTSYNLEILFNQIKEIFYFSNGFLSSKGLTLITKTGGEYQLTMKNRDDWGRSINKMY